MMKPARKDDIWVALSYDLQNEISKITRALQKPQSLDNFNDNMKKLCSLIDDGVKHLTENINDHGSDLEPRFCLTAGSFINIGCAAKHSEESYQKQLKEYEEYRKNKAKAKQMKELELLERLSEKHKPDYLASVQMDDPSNKKPRKYMG